MFTTLKPVPRNIYLYGQIEDPADKRTRLYPTRFCRSCGQKMQIVGLTETDVKSHFISCSIDDSPLKVGAEDDIAGYLAAPASGNADYEFDGSDAPIQKIGWKITKTVNACAQAAKSRSPAR